MSDPINPEHYQSASMELIDVIDAFGLTFYEAQVVKYVVRARKKNGLEDLRKAQWYLNRLVDLQTHAKLIAEAKPKAEPPPCPMPLPVGDPVCVGFPSPFPSIFPADTEHWR